MINMPEFKIPFYGILLLSSFLISFIMDTIILKKKGVKFERIGLSFLLILLMSLMGGVMFHLICDHEFGLSSYGGAIGLILAVIIYGLIDPDNFKEMYKVYLINIPFIYSLGKVGCFIGGCCYGIPYSGFLSVQYNSVDHSVLPVQLIEAFVFMIIFIICLIRYLKNKKYNTSYILILCGLAKLILEYFRDSNIGKVIFPNQIVSIIFIIVGIYLLFKENKSTSYN